MDRDDFKTWLDEHTTCFAMVGRFFADRPQDVRRSILVRWCDALADVEMEDAIAVTHAMQRGDVEHPSEFNLDWLPSRIRGEARRLRAERDRDQRNRELQPESWGKKPRGVPMAEALAQYSETGELPGDPDDGPRVSCPLCFDNGSVDIYHPKSVAAMRRGEVRHPAKNPDGRASLYRAGVCCTCRIGDKMPEWFQKRGRFVERMHRRLTKTRSDDRWDELHELVDAETQGEKWSPV